MARKSRKHPAPKLTIQPSRDIVGYIRLSVRDQDPSGSIESQRLMIEEWDSNIKSQFHITMLIMDSAGNVLTVRHSSR